MKTAAEIFTELGKCLAAFGKDDRSAAAIAAASADNGWFSAEEICRAAEALQCGMLRRDKLQRWLLAYDTIDVESRRVAVIMAGNIPMVGFFDLMCVVACGHTAVVKPSAKDRALIEYIIDLLRETEPEVKIEVIGDSSLATADIDAVIAMGGDNTKRHLKSMFEGKPQLLRGNRHSVAVLSGNETESDKYGLREDMFLYSGLGCRNVSLIFVPRGYSQSLPTNTDVNPKYRNNYLQNRALMTMQGEKFTDTGSCLLIDSREFPSAVSVVAVSEYDDIAEVQAWLAEHDAELQCVVSECVQHSRRVGFGQSQHPTLTDYPDDADVMEFLTHL